MSREQAIIKLIPVFRQYGYEGTTLSLLSKASGLGKASLYHHFPGGKDEMVNAVFEYVGDWFRDVVLKPLHFEDKPAKKIQAMGESLKQFYDNGNKSCFLAIMSFGGAKNLLHNEIKQGLKLWIDTLAKVVIEAGIESEIAEMRSQDAIMEIQGALILVRILDDTAPFDRVIKSLPEKLLG